MDRIDAMQAFARVVETGSFTRAAETLQVGKTTVTQLVQQLETRLRVKLLNRTTRKVNVTADGAAYYERVVRVLADIDDAETSLSVASASPRGRLRVDVPSPLASMIVVPALPAFFERHPDIQLELGASDRTVDLIDENVDCVVRGGGIADPSLVARHVGDLVLRMYASPAYLQRAGMPDDPAALADAAHRIVGYRGARRGRLVPYTITRGSEQVQVRGRHALVVDDGQAYLAAGVAGLGALWLPDYMAQPHVARGALVELFTEWQMQPMPLHVAYPANRHVSRKLRVFIDWIAGLIALHAPVLPRAAPIPTGQGRD